MKEYIENVLAPKLQGDGGWVEFVSYENKKLTLIFRGECSKCLNFKPLRRLDCPANQRGKG